MLNTNAAGNRRECCREQKGMLPHHCRFIRGLNLFVGQLIPIYMPEELVFWQVGPSIAQPLHWILG